MMFVNYSYKLNNIHLCLVFEYIIKLYTTLYDEELISFFLTRTVMIYIKNSGMATGTATSKGPFLMQRENFIMEK